MKTNGILLGGSILVAFLLVCGGDVLAGESLADLIRAARASIVRVEGQAARRNKRDGDFELLRGGEKGWLGPRAGTGFVWDEAGHVVTAKNAVDRAARIRVTTFDGFTRDAELLGCDPGTGLALLEVKGLEAPPVRLAGEAELGQRVIAAGYAWGARRPFFSAGILSDTRAPVLGVLSRCLQTDASMPPGMGGGPLLSADGEVLGVNLALSGRRSGAIVGFALPADEVRRIVPVLLRGEIPKRGALGMTVARREGKVLIAGILKGSAAEKAGLREGDVVLRVEGMTVHSEEDLAQAAWRRSPGEIIELEVEREGGSETVSVSLGPWRPPPFSPRKFQLLPGGTFELKPIAPDGADVRAGPFSLLRDPLLVVPRLDEERIPISDAPFGELEAVEITRSAGALKIRFRGKAYASAEALSEGLASGAPARLTVRASRDVPFGPVCDVIDRLRRVGVLDVSIATKEP